MGYAYESHLPRASMVKAQRFGHDTRMPYDEDSHETVTRMLDHLFRDATSVSRFRVLQHAEVMSLPEYVLALFHLLPPGSFTRRALVDQLNSAIVGHGLGRTLGTFD